MKIHLKRERGGNNDYLIYRITLHKTGWDAGVSSLHRIVCKVWTVRNRPVNLTPRKRETRDLRIEAPSSKRVQREGGE